MRFYKPKIHFLSTKPQRCEWTSPDVPINTCVGLNSIIFYERLASIIPSLLTLTGKGRSALFPCPFCSQLNSFDWGLEEQIWAALREKMKSKGVGSGDKDRSSDCNNYSGYLAISLGHWVAREGRAERSRGRSVRLEFELTTVCSRGKGRWHNLQPQLKGFQEECQI